jgi:hypothetical protein
MKIENLKVKILIVALLLLVAIPVGAEENPAAEGFDAAGSDAKAVEIADAVMVAMGGRKAWDDARHITWKFFGRRLHVWDKATGNIRVESQNRNTKKNRVVLMNIHTKAGRAWEEGVEITDREGLKKALRGAEGAWINDSYWLLMPYKLKDSGVTLKYVGEKEDPDGNVCEVLELTFKEVGRTPQNKYHVFVDKASRMVCHWDYWKDKAVDEPRSLGPWNNWRKFGDIMLTDDHGRRKHGDVAVLESLPDAVFTDPAPFKLEAYQ